MDNRAIRRRYAAVAIVLVGVLFGVIGAELGIPEIASTGGFSPFLQAFFVLATAIFVGIEGVRLIRGLRQPADGDSLETLWIVIPMIFVLLIAAHAILAVTKPAELLAGIVGG
jgi:hypothetical protein